MPDVAPFAGHDWWLLVDAAGGGERVIAMHYDDDDQFVGAAEHVDPRSVSGFVAARDILWGAAEEFEPWWARHGELHRDGRSAA